jgi:hypothetical protein
MLKLPLVSALLLTVTAAVPAAAQSASTGTLFDGAATSSSHQSVSADSGPQTLSDYGRLITHNGWYLAPSAGFTYVNSGVSPTFGLRGAWRINRKFGIGLAATGFDFEDEALDRDNLEAGYGGLLLEYVLNSDDLAHAVIDTTLGGGAVCLDEGNRNDCDDAHGFFVAEPTFNLELNVTSFMRAAVGGGYRVAIAEKRLGISSSDLSGFVGRVSLEFGRF